MGDTFNSYRSGLGACHMAIQMYQGLAVAEAAMLLYEPTPRSSRVMSGPRLASLLRAHSLPAKVYLKPADALCHLAYRFLGEQKAFFWEVRGDMPEEDRRWALVYAYHEKRLHWAECSARVEPAPNVGSMESYLTGKAVGIELPLPEGSELHYLRTLIAPLGEN